MTTVSASSLRAPVTVAPHEPHATDSPKKSGSIFSAKNLLLGSAALATTGGGFALGKSMGHPLIGALTGAAIGAAAIGAAILGGATHSNDHYYDGYDGFCDYRGDPDCDYPVYYPPVDPYPYPYPDPDPYPYPGGGRGNSYGDDY